MAKQEVRLPEISESAEKGTVTSVLVSKGDRIEKDDPIIEIESDKAAVEVPSDAAGTVTEVHASEGDELEAGDLILTVETEGTEEAPDTGEAEPEGEPEPEPKPEPEAEPEGEPEPEPEPKPEPEAEPKAEPEPKGRQVGEEVAAVPAAPSTRRLAREIGVDIHAVSGRGPGGRITAEDVKRHAREGGAGAGGGRAAGGGPSGVRLPDFSKWGGVHREPLSQVRKITARNTQASWQTVPHVTQHDEADVSALERFRHDFAKPVEKAGGKLTVTAILLHLVAKALRRYPRFNASLDMDSMEVIYKDYVHVGVAVDTDRGLLVPVVRDADRKTITELSVELTNLASRARDKKIKPDEMEGGTFTISNLGGIGGTAFTPVIFAPQVAILGVARAAERPVFRRTQGEDEKLVSATILPLSLSYDHRIIDGADGARFLRYLAAALEQPLAADL